MLTASRYHEPRMDVPYHAAPPRTALSRFTSGVQLLGSLVGIPLALIGGYSTYHANFSPEAKCQALRANIIAMLDKKADASTLRMLVHRDVVTFERDCGVVDADAVAAFKTLLVAEKPAVQRTPQAKVEAAAAERPVKTKANAEAVAKAEKAERPVKAEAAKPDKPKFDVAKIEAVVKPETPKPAEAATTVAPSSAAADSSQIDAVWVASVRDVLRESALRAPAGETGLAAPMPPAIIIQPANPELRKADHPVPPAAIPNADVIAQPAN